MLLSGLLGASVALAVGCDAGEPEEASAQIPPATAAVGTPTATGTPGTTPEATPIATPGAGETVDPTPGGNPDGEPTADDAVDVLDAYFSAIATGDFETAYVLWSHDGEASGQAFEEFAAGFAATASVTWEVREPGRIDPGAGQRYIEIPVTVTAVTTDGETQHFEGTYVLHHTGDIEGATAEQRVWRIQPSDSARSSSGDYAASPITGERRPRRPRAGPRTERACRRRARARAGRPVGRRAR